MNKEEKLQFLRNAGPHLEGKKVNCTFYNKYKITGKLSFYEGNVYICQNEEDGCRCKNTHGFLYSYQANKHNIINWDISFIEGVYEYGSEVYSKTHGKCTYLCAVHSKAKYHKGHLIVTSDGLIYDVNDLTECEETVELNNSYSAVVNNDGITVGCQKFDFAALDNLVKAANKFRK